MKTFLTDKQKELQKAEFKMDPKDQDNSIPTVTKRKMRLTCDERIEILERKIQILSNEVQAYKERLKNDSDEDSEDADDDDNDDDMLDEISEDDEDNNDKEDEHDDEELNTDRLDCARANVVDRSLYQLNIFNK